MSHGAFIVGLTSWFTVMVINFFRWKKGRVGTSRFASQISTVFLPAVFILLEIKSLKDLSLAVLASGISLIITFSFLEWRNRRRTGNE